MKATALPGQGQISKLRRMTPETRNLFSLVGMAIAILATVALLDLAMDPLQLFHHAMFSPARYSGDQRLQNAGLIQSQSFNAVLMGTSLAAALQPSKIDAALKVRSIKLAMNGSGAREQSFALEAALNKNVDVAIWEIDHWIFRNDRTDFDNQRVFPADLYRNNLRGKIEYLLSIDTALESLGLLVCDAAIFRPVYSRLANWGYLRFVLDDVDLIGVSSDDSNYSAALGINAYRRLSNPNVNYGSANGYVLQALLDNFEYDVVSLIERHPKVRFLIYFPPYSMLHYAAMRDFAPDALQTFFDLSTAMNRRLVSLPNVELFDFRDIDAVTHNLDNYRDTRHFRRSVDSYLLESLRDGSHRVSKDRPTAALDRLKRQVATYEVPGL